MSVNITVNGNAIGEKPARPICGRNLAKEKSDEIERRRKLRLQQVCLHIMQLEIIELISLSFIGQGAI